MNEEQQAALGMILSELERKDTEELQVYLVVTRVIGFIAACIGIGLLLLTMFIPTFLMFIAAILIFPMAFRLSLVTDIIKREVKRIVKERDD